MLFGETPELTGGEHLIADALRDARAARAVHGASTARYVDEIESHGADLMGSQPTQGNIAGGLSTIEEKALGNIEKTGTKPVVGRARAGGGAVERTPGLYFMDSSSAAAEHITLMCAGGAVAAPLPDGAGQRDRQSRSSR